MPRAQPEEQRGPQARPGPRAADRHRATLLELQVPRGRRGPAQELREQQERPEEQQAQPGQQELPGARPPQVPRERLRVWS